MIIKNDINTQIEWQLLNESRIVGHFDRQWIEYQTDKIIEDVSRKRREYEEAINEGKFRFRAQDDCLKDI